MLRSFTRAILLYPLLVLVLRLLGKRQISQLEPSEFAVAMLVADLASIPMQDCSLPLFTGVIPIVTVLVIELLASYIAMKSLFLRRLLCGKPLILIENGRLLQGNLRRARITVDEMVGQLRSKEVLTLETVQFAILETNGSLSVFCYPENRPAEARAAGVEVSAQYLPVTLISDGRLLEKNLTLSGRDRAWVEKQLKKRKLKLADTLLLTVDAGAQVVCIPKER